MGDVWGNSSFWFSGFARGSFVGERCRDSPRRARYFLAVRQESTQRNAPHLCGWLSPSGSCRYPGPMKPGSPPSAPKEIPLGDASPGRAASKLAFGSDSRTLPFVLRSGRQGRGKLVDRPLRDTLNKFRIALVIPAKAPRRSLKGYRSSTIKHSWGAGIQEVFENMDSRLRGNDGFCTCSALP